jgi:quercetin dioxygenase-like cupin family protein
MQMILSSAWLLLGAAVASIPTQPSATLLENGEVKVLRAFEQANGPGKFHQHTMNRVMVYLEPGRQRFQYQDGRKPETFDWQAGQVVWSPADGMHAGEVLDHPFNIIEIELKNTGTAKPISAGQDPLKVAPGDYKLEFENPQVRVLRVMIPPHASVPMHAHTLDRVTIFLTDQHFSSKDSTGKVTTADHKAGDVAWGTPTEHAEQNLGDQPFEAVVVELK